MSASRSNSFGSFLQTMNVDKSPQRPSGPEFDKWPLRSGGPDFDIESAAKLVLGRLVLKSGNVDLASLPDFLNATPEEIERVVGYLVDSGMVDRAPGKLALSSYGHDAVGYLTTPNSPPV